MASAMDGYYEVVGRILVHMASIGLKRIQSVNHENVVKMFGALSDKPAADSILYQDALEWMFAEDLLRASKGGSSREGVFIFSDVQLTAKGIGVIEANPDGGHGLAKSIKETEVSTSKGGLSSDTYGKIGSFVGGLLGGFAQSAQ